MRSDIEIAQACPMQHIRDIAREAGIAEEYLEQYGNYKAKIDTKFFQDHQGPDGKLILVTAITPTPAGEGKTTTTVGLADGLRKIGKKSVVALREPSLGPVRLAAAMPRWCLWRTSTSTSPGTSTPLAQPIICWPRCWTTTFSRAIPWALT